MPRNAAGVYTLPTGNPVVTGTIISSTWANPTMDDFATEIQDSLSRSGNGGMLAQLVSLDGTAAAPANTHLSDLQTGWYLAAVGDLRLATAGVDRLRITTAAGMEVWDVATATWYPVVDTQLTGGSYETQTLIALQTVVPFTKNVAGASIYINGAGEDRGRLLLGDDYTYDAGLNEVTLLTTYTAGTKVTAVVNDQTDVAAAAAAAGASAVAAAASAVEAAVQVGLAEDQVALAADQVALAADQVTLAAAEADAAAASAVLAQAQVALAAAQVTLAAAEADAAAASAALAASYAAGLNLPPVTAADAGNALVVKSDGTGYEVSTNSETATLFKLGALAW